MNFQELMSKASANNIIVSKQLMKSGQKHKESGPGVSTSAVKAFLERKEQERKKKQADEEAARRARIQARLQQNLKPNQEKKGKSTPKSSFLNPPYATGEAEEVRSIQGKQKKDDVPLQHQKSAALSKPSVSGRKSKEINKNATTNKRKTKDSERISKEKPLKSNNFVTNEKKNDTSKVKKKSKPGPAQPNFKDLLAIAEQNKSGLKRKPEAVPAGKRQVGVKASKAKRQSIGHHKLTKIDEKDIHIKNKGKLKQTDSQRKPAVEPDKISEKYRPCIHERTKTVETTRDLNTRVQNGLDKKASRPLYARTQERKTFYVRPAPGYFYDEDEEEDSDLDGFIDDAEDEACGGQTDVSKYIKDIFGYDRRRYAMEDIDDCAMESNFGQIEREEKRSAKIAKLEDEIEILKEQAELKRQKNRLRSKKAKK